MSQATFCRDRCGLLGIGRRLHRWNSESCVETCSYVPLVTPKSYMCGGCNFDIMLDVNGATRSIESDVMKARDRWESIITGDLPGFAAVDLVDDKNKPIPPGSDECSYPAFIDDLYICVLIAEIDGASGVLGAAGPRISRSNAQPLTAFMVLDSADTERLETEGRLHDIALHEIAHVLGLLSATALLIFTLRVVDLHALTLSWFDLLGLGTRWKKLGLVGDEEDGCPYNGTAATREFLQIATECDFLPIELDGGNGTACGHWDERCLDDELMTGNADPDNPLSRVTIAGMEDLGYTVDYSSAQAFDAADLGECECSKKAKTSRQFKSSTPTLSKKLQDEAIAYGTGILGSQQFSASRAFNGLQYVGDDVISVIVEENGRMFGVLVESDV